MRQSKRKTQVVLIQIIIYTCLLIKASQAKEVICRMIWLRGKGQKVCQTICDQNCVDDVCEYIPQSCVCKKGYHPEKKRCEPDCAAGCPSNSTCVSGTNYCLCNVGYTQNKLKQCSPVCSIDCGENSFCSAPDVCTCKKGYAKTIDGCTPICLFECGDHEHCATPNNCACDEGYSWDLTGKCTARCSVHCGETSFCSAPDVCTCKKGYAETSIGCTPICAEGCGSNEYCSSPNICNCTEGYTRDLAGMCTPVCNIDCDETSYCSAPDVCACRQGYAKTNIGCTPICAQICGENEYCSGPNKCSCKEGYAKDLTGKCAPICSPDCEEDSICSAPNVCSCKTGYEQTKDGCSPICSQACVNGHCVAPNKCACYTGYQHVTADDSNCQPECDFNICGNATCLGPGICECPKGYERHHGIKDCLPACSADCGPNSICVAPQQRCDCVEGYRRSGDQCVPHCKHGCGINAHCTQPDVCQCMDGFENKPLLPYNLRCQPMCEQSCPLHAYCAAPNHCSCIAGYTLVDGSCVPRCKDQCGTYSSCVAPDKCHCDKGFLEKDGKCLSSAELNSCMKEVIFKMHVACETSSFVIYLIYGGLMSVLFICALVSYKGLQHLRRRIPNNSQNHRPPPQNYIITYQPRSDGNELGEIDCEMASSSYSQPPAYNTLTRKC